MKTALTFIAILLCAAGFALGIFKLFQLRFDTGDVYPEYSSLRADPRGTMALFESLEKLPALTVKRDFSAGNKLPDDNQTTYFHLGARPSECISMPLDLVKEIEGFASGGGRLAITLLPENFRFPPRATLNRTNDQASARFIPDKRKKARKKVSSDDPELSSPFTSLKERWGLEITSLPKNKANPPAELESLPENQTETSSLPPSLDWHSHTVFTNLAPTWHVLYARDSHPVLIERKFGSGSIVIASDTWFLSNEAMLKDRQPALLAWLVGPHRQVVFDEAHFGLVETAGVATLLRKYRLGGLVAAFVLLAALFIWKNSFSLVPPLVEASDAATVSGKEAAAGFINLLRRNIPSREALSVCFDEWKKSHPQAGTAQAARIARAEAVLHAEVAKPKNQRDPIATYQKIASNLKGT
jgi:hypothetical protein